VRVRACVWPCLVLWTCGAVSWLEFLGNVRLREDEKFDATRAVDRCEAGAVETIVSSAIDGMIRDGARAANVPLDAEALNVLRAEVTRASEAGVPQHEAVDSTLRGWGSEVRRSLPPTEPACRPQSPSAAQPTLRYPCPHGPAADRTRLPMTRGRCATWPLPSREPPLSLLSI
jgi:hypothetical protein